MISERLYLRSTGFGGAIDEATGFIDEDFDPRGRHANVGRARFARLPWYSLVHEERGTVQMKAGNAAQVPEFAGVERRPVPANCRGGVGNDQHHRQQREVGFAAHGSRLSERDHRARIRPDQGGLRRPALAGSKRRGATE